MTPVVAFVAIVAGLVLLYVATILVPVAELSHHVLHVLEAMLG